MNNSQSNSQSFNDSELLKGFHLLTESSHTVKVNTPSVPTENEHLYPRLAGWDWTSYLSQLSVILGRSGTAAVVRSSHQKQPQPQPQRFQADVDFGSSKAISRKHCEVRFSNRRDRWELYVHGRNGIKINHIAKKPKDRPTVLHDGALIEINNTTFVFILPNNYIKPGGFQGTEEFQETNTPNNDVDDLSLDHELETAMVNILEKNTCLDTKEIMGELKKTYTKPVKKENVLYLLVLSPRFYLAPNSISMSSKESDSVKWKLIPPSTDLPTNKNNKEDDYSISAEKSTGDMSITTTPATLVNSLAIEQEKNQLIHLESTDDMSIASTPALGKDTNALNNARSRDDMSISTPNNEHPPFFLPRLSSMYNRDTPTIPITSASFSRFFDADEGWSVFMPDDGGEAQNEGEEEDETSASNDPPINGPNPIQFRGMSVESMYSIWSHASSFVGDPMDNHENVRPSKRMRTMDNSTEDMNMDRDSQQTVNIDIFKELRTKIVY